MNLRTKIQLPIVALIILIAACSGFLSYRQSSKELTDALVDRLRGEAQAIVRTTANLSEVLRANVERIAAREELIAFFKEGDIRDRERAEQFSAVLQGILKTYRGIDRITVLDDKGTITTTTAVQSIGQNFGDRDYFKGAILGKTTSSEPLLSRVTGKGVINTGAPIRVDGKIVGIVYTSTNLETFFEANIKPIVVGKEGYAFVLAKNGQIVMHANPEYLFKDLSTTPVYREIAGSTTPGVREYIGVNGTLVYNYYQTDPLSGLTAVVQAESSDVFSGLAQLRNTAILVAIVSAVAGAALLYFLLWPVMAALNRCIRYAQCIAEGDFEQPLAVRRKDELGKMADALRSIPERLKGLAAMADELASRVRCGRLRERTDPAALPGAYADLSRAFNEIADAYTVTLDQFPPFMACSSDCTILFLNAPAQSVIRGDHTGTRCAGHLKAPECDTNACLGRKCMAVGPLVQETVVNPVTGRLDVSVDAVPIKDRDGKVVGFQEVLMDITRVKATERTIQKVAEQAVEISDRVASASENLSAQVEQVSRGAETQRERVKSTSSAMTKMNATVLEVARSAGQASEQSDMTKNKAGEGAGLVDNVVRSINSVNAVASTLQSSMHELGAKAESVGGVMNVISDIADQTNLLALNAAIEAARAGEAGRGFAVVADEVRKLAEKTMAATQEVGGSISAIQQSAKTNMVEVENAVTAIAEATGLANTSGKALVEIVELATHNSAVVASIATAAEEQSATSEEINGAIDEINRIVSETTDGMVHASAAVQELTHMARQMESVIGELKDLKGR